MEWRKASRLVPETRIDNRASANARFSHSSANGPFVGAGGLTDPQSCIPPMSWIPSISPPPGNRAANKDLPSRARRDARPGRPFPNLIF